MPNKHTIARPGTTQEKKKKPPTVLLPSKRMLPDCPVSHASETPRRTPLRKIRLRE